MGLRGVSYINYCYYNLRHTTFCYCGVRVIISKPTFYTIRFLFLRTRIFHTITGRALEARNTWRTIPTMLGRRISSWSFSRLEEKLNNWTKSLEVVFYGQFTCQKTFWQKRKLKSQGISNWKRMSIEQSLNFTGFRPGSNAGNLHEPNLIRIKAD